MPVDRPLMLHWGDGVYKHQSLGLSMYLFRSGRLLRVRQPGSADGPFGDSHAYVWGLICDDSKRNAFGVGRSISKWGILISSLPW